MFRFATLLLIPIAGFCGPYDGRWDITAYDGSKRLAWWLEISGGTNQVSGTFVGAPGGGVDRIPEIRIENGMLHFRFPGKYADRVDPKIKRAGVFKAELAGDRLQGTQQVEGESKVVMWSGVRAPAFPLDDPEMWKEGAPVELFNGRDLSGWSLRSPDRSGWQVVNGALKNSESAADLVSEAKFWNFKLHAEYRIGPKSNSGIGLRGRYEVQILDDFGRAPAMNGNGALYGRIAPAVNATLPPGEWQSADITLIGDILTVVLNGKTIIKRERVDGLTAIANNSDESQPGPFILQGDHGIVEFRKFNVTPLVRR